MHKCKCKNYKLLNYQHTTINPQFCHNSAISNSVVMLSVNTNDVVATNQGISLFGFYNITNYTATLKAWSLDCIAAVQQ